MAVLKQQSQQNSVHNRFWHTTVKLSCPTRIQLEIVLASSRMLSHTMLSIHIAVLLKNLLRMHLLSIAKYRYENALALDVIYAIIYANIT